MTPEKIEFLLKMARLKFVCQMSLAQLDDLVARAKTEKFKDPRDKIAADMINETSEGDHGKLLRSVADKVFDYCRQLGESEADDETVESIKVAVDAMGPELDELCDQFENLHKQMTSRFAAITESN